MSGKIYNIKTGKKITNGKTLKLKEYTLRVIYECSDGHLFAEEYFSDKIMSYGMDECLKNSINENEKKFCPECDEVTKIGKRYK